MSDLAVTPEVAMRLYRASVDVHLAALMRLEDAVVSGLPPQEVEQHRLAVDAAWKNRLAGRRYINEAAALVRATPPPVRHPRLSLIRPVPFIDDPDDGT